MFVKGSLIFVKVCIVMGVFIDFTCSTVSLSEWRLCYFFKNYFMILGFDWFSR